MMLPSDEHDRVSVCDPLAKNPEYTKIGIAIWAPTKIQFLSYFALVQAYQKYTISFNAPEKKIENKKATSNFTKVVVSKFRYNKINDQNQVEAS